MKALWRISVRAFAGIFLWLFVFVNAAFPMSAFAATPPPRCEIIVNPTTIPVGGSVTVKWQSINATAGAITNIGNVSPSGSINLLPSSAAVTTYFGAFTGPGGTANCQASVAVNASAGFGGSNGTVGTTNTGTTNLGSTNTGSVTAPTP